MVPLLAYAQHYKKYYTAQFAGAAAAYGLNQLEIDILLFLHNNPEYDRAADIVSRRGIAKSHVSLSVSNLESRGLLIRCFEPSDRRTAHLKLTEAGNAIAREGRDIQQQFFSRIYEGVSDEEFEIWRTITQKVCKNIESLDESLKNP